MRRWVFTTWFTHKTATFAFAAETLEELSTLRQLVEAGKITSIVDRVVGMDQVREAHRRVETEERRGAVVMQIGAPP